MSDEGSRKDELEAGLRGVRPEADVDARVWRAAAASALFGRSAEPMTLGRYTVRRRVGGGGAGVVYTAQDPKLDRVVAIKLLHSATDSAAVEREARVLARLNHPHVVAVYDVGEHDGQAFIAMEYVPGPTLAGWLAAQVRTWKEIVDVFVAASLGLAAAHDAGLVHGDIKPTNIIVGSDGRVRVSDFGIARVRDDSGAGDEDGVRSGTPAYMAPEQFGQGAADPRSDQFSLCVALYEALDQTRPFAGDSVAEIHASMRAGHVLEGPMRAPRWLGRIVRRGLSIEPADRYPSVAALTTDINRWRYRAQRRMRRMGLILGMVGLSVAAAAAPGWLREYDERCVVQAPGVSEIWPDATRERIQSRFQSSGFSFADRSWESVDAQVVAYVERLELVSHEVCHVLSEQSDQARAQQCLSWRARDLSAFVNALEAADRDVVTHAAAGAPGLADPRSCLLRVRPVAKGRTTQPEPSEGSRDVQGRLSAARALRAVGKSKEAGPLLDDALARARALEDISLQGWALLELGLHRADTVGLTSQGATEATLDAARLAAEAAGDPVLIAVATLELANANLRSARFGPARKWLEQARLSVGDSQGWLRGRMLFLDALLGEVESNEAARGDSRNRLSVEEAIDRFESTPGAAPWLGRALNLLGEMEFERGHNEEAGRHYRRALALSESMAALNHPRSADYRGNLGEVEFLAGRLGPAAELFAESEAIRIRAYGEDTFIVAHTRGHLADVALASGQLDKAAALYRRMLEWVERRRATHGAERPEGRLAFMDADMGLGQLEPWAHNGLALIALQRGDPAVALGHADLAQGAQVRVGRHPDLASRLDVRARALVALGRSDEARAHIERVLPQIIGVYGRDHAKTRVVLEVERELARR